MSGKVSGMVWELDLPQEHAWLLMSLADHANHDGTKVYPGASLTAWKTGYSVRHVKRLTADLIHKYDLLEVVKPGGGAEPAEYRIKLASFKKLAKPEPKKRGRPKKTHDTQNTGLDKKKPMTREEKTHDTKPKTHDTHTRARLNRQVEPPKKEETYSRRDADASSEDEKTNWFTLLCNRFKEVGLPVSDEDRDSLPGNLVKCVMKEGATDQEMHRVVGRIVTRRLERAVVSPQRALGDIRGHGQGDRGQEPFRRQKKRVSG